MCIGPDNHERKAPLMTQIYFAATPKQWPLYRDTLAQACARLGLDVTITQNAPDPAAVDYIIF